MNLDRMKFPTDLMPVDQMGFSADHGSTCKWNGSTTFNNLKDYKNWLVRIDGYLDWLKSAKLKCRKV